MTDFANKEVEGKKQQDDGFRGRSNFYNHERNEVFIRDGRDNRREGPMNGIKEGFRGD